MAAGPCACDRPRRAVAVTRVVIVMPKLARDVVRSPLAGADGIEVVAEVDRDDELLAAATAAAADVAIVATRDGDLTPALRGALYAQPRLSMVALNVRDGALTVHVLRPRGHRMGTMSPRDLPRVVQAAARWGADG
jgi:DNA-binding NarL/FixJ family response regulator